MEADGLASTDVALPALEVRVRHASLEHASYRLYVGHFQGLPLSGGEARLNQRSEGRLERLLVMNLYPQRLGDLVLLEPVDEAPPQGIAVLGLGPAGELAAAELRGVFTRALLRVALEELDRRLNAGTERADRAEPLGVTSVLIGSSAAGGLAVETSVRALIDATRAANARLTRLHVTVGDTRALATDVVYFRVLELIERYEDRIDLIVSVLARLKNFKASGLEPRESRLQPVIYVLEPKRAEGASGANSPIDLADEVWRRVDIHADPNSDGSVVRLEFTSVGRLARAERLISDVEWAIVDKVLANAISDDADPDVSGTLFELLVPHELKGELGSAEHLHLLVDESTADIPWELLRPRPDDQEAKAPLALRVGLLRQFREAERIRFEARRASGNNALVIGNPPTPRAPSLGGAASEATAVARTLSAAGWNVEPLVWDTDGKMPDTDSQATLSPLTALHKLMNGDWRVVHIAAHGEFTAAPTSTGVLLGDFRLTANLFLKLSIVPDFVMINACHLGRIGSRTLAGANRMAASVARALLQIGVRAVIVAGWAVDDTAAEVFAGALYGHLLAGRDLGAAVAAARHETWTKAKRSLTWGAYQCYGDPGFRLETRSARTTPPEVWTVGELSRRISRLASVASDQGRTSPGDTDDAEHHMREELERLTTYADTLRAPEVVANLAEVWADLLEYDRAIELYRQGLVRGGSSVHVRAVEQLGNLLIRKAQRSYRQSPSAPFPEEEVTESLRWLERAIDIGRSGERLAMLGSYHKKLATMCDPAGRSEEMCKAVHYYTEAQKTDPKPYHQYNCVQLAQVARLSGYSLGDEATIDTETAKVREAVAARRHPPPTPDQAADGSELQPDEAEDFWSRARHGDLLLSALLLETDTSAGAEREPIAEMVDAYKAAFALRSSGQERASVTDHLLDLAELLPPDHPWTKPLHRAHEHLGNWQRRIAASDPSGMRT